MMFRSSIQRFALSATVLLAGLGSAGMLAGVARADGCANEQLRAEQPYGLGLPDCRAYEKVSPEDKGGSNVIAGLTRAALSGDGLVYTSRGSFASTDSFTEPAGALYRSAYVSRRGSASWQTQNITPPTTTYESSIATPYEEMIFSPELTRGLLLNEYFSLNTSEIPQGYSDEYEADFSSGSYRALAPPPPGVLPYTFSETLHPLVTAATRDLSRVVYQERTNLTAGASPQHEHIYEWMNGQLTLVDVPPTGKTFEAEDGVGSGDIYGGPLRGDPWRAVSDDGTRVFFTAGEGAEHTNSRGQVYLREIDQDRTIEASASQKTNGAGPGGSDPDGPQQARYWGAATDGSKVLFTSLAELTNDANTGAHDEAPNLYEYDVASGVLSDLSVDTHAGDVEGAKVLGVVTAAEDASYVYFVADGDLAGSAVSGRPNLYLSHAGVTTFIATLDPNDERDWFGGPEGVGGPATHTVQVTPDGTHLAFESVAELTSFDNEAVDPAACEGPLAAEGYGQRPCSEIYVFDTANGLACVSCDPDGARPVSNATFEGFQVSSGAEQPGQGSPFYTPRNFSDDGSRLFFQTGDALVPHDSNGRLDVYEYEDGISRLVSDGAGNFDTYFLDGSPSGNDVFVATADRLLPQDSDQRIDAYDARVEGGFPVASSPAACENGDSCKAPPSEQPTVFGAPPSATFQGAGNLAPLTKAAVKPSSRTLTRAQKLTSALRSCKKKTSKRRRKSCEAQARKRYGAAPKHTARRSSQTTKSNGRSR